MSYESVVLADSPTFLWLLNETTGSAAADATGNGHGGNYGGTYTQGAPGPLFQALAVTLDGSSGAVSSGSIANSGTFSAECWFKTSTAAGGGIVQYGRAPAVAWMLNNGTVSAGIYDGSSIHAADSSAAFNGGAWHYLVFTYAGTTFKLYLDGILAASGTSPSLGGGASTAWYAGDGDNTASVWPGISSSNFLAGTLAAMAVYPVALTQAQVTAHYAASGYAPPAASKVHRPASLPSLCTATL